MLETLSILPEKQGRSQAALLAAGVSQGELGAASVRYHSFPAECLGILAFWNWNSETGKAPLAQGDDVRRPNSHKCSIYLNCYVTFVASWTLGKLYMDMTVLI